MTVATAYGLGLPAVDAAGAPVAASSTPALAMPSEQAIRYATFGTIGLVLVLLWLDGRVLKR
jgi:hypothetical protein